MMPFGNVMVVVSFFVALVSVEVGVVLVEVGVVSTFNSKGSSSVRTVTGAGGNNRKTSLITAVQ